ncbi:hypothetical protein [Rhodovulum sp. 12E13]|nr:hypothetical protein [Rhodovulum sp. 12E13]
MQTILHGLEPTNADKMLLVCIRFEDRLIYRFGFADFRAEAV